MYNKILDELISLKNDEKKEVLQYFFKTGKGEYGEGDIFLGIVVPILRKLSKKYYNDASLNDCIKLLHNKYHESRLIALFILVLKYDKGDNNIREEIYNLYLNNTSHINNWDLVDLSASYIVGRHIYENNIDRGVLYDLVDSNDLWNQRIAILSTHYFIKKDVYNDTLKICELLMNTKHDLLRKALGWMLREIGKRNDKVLHDFLNKYYKVMPRTMLRYSIERMSNSDKNYYMNK